MARAPARGKATTKRKPSVRRLVRCYLCGHESDVSTKTMSTTCPGCNKAIKIEDVIIKSYLPVNEVQTCGKIKITKRGRVVAKLIQSGDGIECLGAMEGAVETDGPVSLGAKASWKGPSLLTNSLQLVDGAKLDGVITVPWHRKKTRKRTKRT